MGAWCMCVYMEQKTSTDAVVEYFEGSRQCTVADVGPGRVELTDIPSSGGAQMLPGSFGAIEVLADEWGSYDVTYTEGGCVITRE